MRRAWIYGVVCSGVSLPLSFTAYAYCQEQGSSLLYYIFLLPLALVVRDCSTISLSRASLAGFISYGIAGIALGTLVGRRRAIPKVGSFWQRHRYATILPPAGGVLWVAGIFLGLPWDTMFFLHLFFLPFFCISYTFEPIPDWLAYVLMPVGVPAQYLAAGVLVDLLRRTRSSRDRALAVSLIAVAIFAFALWFATAANPHDPDSTYPPPHEVRALVGAYALFAIGLLVLAVKNWRGRGARRIAKGRVGERAPDGSG